MERVNTGGLKTFIYPKNDHNHNHYTSTDEVTKEHRKNRRKYINKKIVLGLIIFFIGLIYLILILLLFRDSIINYIISVLVLIIGFVFFIINYIKKYKLKKLGNWITKDDKIYDYRKGWTLEK